MYAVIRTGGKQYRVAPDDIVKIEKVEAAEGDVIELPEVLMIGKDGADPQLGAPTIEGARVAAEVLEQGRGEKIIIFKKKRRKNHRRKNGHRQHLTTIRVLEVLEASQKTQKARKAASALSKARTSPDEGTPTAPVKQTTSKKAETASADTSGKTETRKGSKKTSENTPASGVFEKLSAPQGEPDNLKALPGVGAKLAEKLNEYGIFHFHQLAAMSEEDVNEMDAALSLRGRATRDDWISQAKQMLDEKKS